MAFDPISLAITGGMAILKNTGTAIATSQEQDVAPEELGFAGDNMTNLGDLRSREYEGMSGGEVAMGLLNPTTALSTAITGIKQLFAKNRYQKEKRNMIAEGEMRKNAFAHRRRYMANMGSLAGLQADNFNL